MADMQAQTERGTVMLTLDEKTDAKLVATFDRWTESDVLRRGVDWFTSRAALIRAGKAKPIAVAA